MKKARYAKNKKNSFAAAKNKTTEKMLMELVSTEV